MNKKVLIRLRGCAGWSATLLLACSHASQFFSEQVPNDIKTHSETFRLKAGSLKFIILYIILEYSSENLSNEFRTGQDLTLKLI